ncbi:uncharacterized protein LOC122854359 [Aphidius gifuensis]|uniref:uncharacterized protein LOC122854359 n=1 Tax=Aphidius gifuensis TaxID=684658 RepID=UPI001CDBCDA1|nr:uncharacterized protein LOC122854359 [Aphidius gifuensis]
METRQEDFTWLIDQCDKNITHAKPKLKCPDSLKIHNIKKQFIIPSFKVSFIEPENIQIKLDNKYLNQSIINDCYDLKISNCSKFLHDFTYNKSTTNQKLSDIYKLGNSEDDISPGKIIEAQDCFIVIIYKINKVEVNEDSANRIFKNEKNNYFSQLCDRTIEKDIYLYIIITTPGSIVTNADKMPQKFVDNTISKYLFSIAVGEKIGDELKIDVFGGAEISEYQRQYESIFNSININLPYDTYFTKKVIENCTSPVNKHDIEVTQRHVVEAHKLAEKKLSEEIMHNGKLNPNFIAKKRLKEIDETFEEICVSQGDRVRNDPKAVIQLPYIVLKVLKTDSIDDDMDFLNWSIGQSCNATHSLIEQSINCIRRGAFNTFYTTNDEEKDNVNFVSQNEIDPEHKIRLTKCHRVKPHLTFADAEELACFGIDFKIYGKNSQLVKNYNSEKKNSFSLKNTNTNDIDDWLKLSDHFVRTTDNYLESDNHSSVSLALKAIEKSSTNSNDSKFVKEKLNRYLSSRIGRWAKLMSDVAIELSVDARQNFGSSEWGLKKLRNYNLYILFKNNRYPQTTFFTLFWNNNDEIFSRGKNSDCCFVTKKIRTDGYISWIDIVSLNSSKLVNWVKFESQLLSNSVFECENYETIFMENEDLFINENLNDKIIYARQSFLLSILVMMNDKFGLDEIMSHARFMIMEGFKTLPLVPNPGKMLKKFSIVYRSRIEVWTAKKLVETSKKIIKSFGFKCSNVNKKNGKIEWTGLFDPFLHIPLETTDQLMNSMYYNYGKNKNEKSEGNSGMKVVAKILLHEEKLPLTKNYLGHESRQDCKYETHEFSPEVVRVMSSKLGEKLKYKLGPAWKKVLRDEIFNDLNEQDLESISTLKASASFTETDKNQTKRPRVAEAVKNLWLESGKKGWKAIHLLQSALKNTKDSGGIHIDLFKKNQHGGVREIYVMSISARIIQLVLEQIGRTLCNQFNSEIITHPNLKLTTPADHCEQEKKLKKGTGANITVCTSDDATKWNQGHFITKFAIMLCQLTDPIFHAFIITALDLWTRKKILLPTNILKILNKHKTTGELDNLITSSLFNRIYHCFNGRTEERWMASGTNFIQTKTGMMQGILHLTSSLFHTLIQEFMKDNAKHLLEKTFTNIDNVITIMQSSDDSGMIISLPTDNVKDAITKMLACTTIFYMKHEIGKMIGIYPSEKCTVGTINIYEFNSEFFILGSSVRPTRKWIYAVNGLSDSESLYTRQEKNYTLIYQILEGGGSEITAWFCQISQAMLHYRMLGCSISPLWSRYAERLAKILDPTLGFYYIDNPKYCGLASIRFGLWFLSNKSYYLSRKLKNILNTTAKKRQEDKEQMADLYDILGVLSSSVATGSSTKNDDDNKKWKEFVDSLNLDPTWMEKVENCPLILYQRAQNADEFDLRFAVKMHSPGINSEIASDSCIRQLITFSLRVLGKYVLKRYSNTTHNYLNNNSCNNNDKVLNEDEENILFPLRHSYSSLVYLSNKIDISGTFEYRNLKKKRFDLTVFKSPIPNDYSLEKLVAWKWFNIDIPASRKVSQMMFDEYKKSIKWLKDTPSETIIESPFLNQIMMQHYFASTELKDHMVHLNAAPVIGTNKISALRLYMSQNMWPSWRPQQKLSTEAIIDNLHLLSQGIYMTIQSGMKQEIIKNIIFNLLKQSDHLHAPNLKIYRSARPSLYLIQKLAIEISSSYVEVDNNDDADDDDKIGFISQKKLTTWIVKCVDLSVGCFGSFALAQKNINGKNRGPFIWAGRMNECLVRIHGDSQDDYDTCVTKIIVTNSDELRAAWPLFKQWTKDHNATLDIARSYETIDGEKVIARIIKNRLCPETLITVVGIPVVISDTILLKIDDAWFDVNAVRIHADKESISVKIKMNIDDKFLTAVSCPIDYLQKSIVPLAISAYDYLTDVTEYWRCFVTLQSLSIDQVDVILHAIIQDNDTVINELGFDNKYSLLKKLKESFWYCAEEMNLAQENLLIGVNNTYDSSPDDSYIDLKKVSHNSPLEVNKVDEFILLDKHFDDQFYKQALEKDLILYNGIQDDTLNIVENNTLDRFINMPKPLIGKWMKYMFPNKSKLPENLFKIDLLSDKS